MTCRCAFILVVVAIAAGLPGWPARAATPAPATNAFPRPGPAPELFAGTNLPTFRIVIPPAGIESLREAPRKDVRATVWLDGVEYKDVGIHIKGSQGSLQSIDQRPALTLSFNRFDKAGRCHGLRKLHLNNSAEDPSYLTEILCSELFRAAGLPCARAAHATLNLNGRRLGLYVLKEGLTKDFLAQYFADTDGNLYDGGFRLDVDRRLERNNGSGPDDQRDLAQLLAAARETDPQRRWERLGEILDREKFITSTALQVITWNWDGYAMARNNYRIYHDPTTRRLIFIPHGLDQMFWEPEGTLEPRFLGLVARAILTTGPGHRLYRQELARLTRDVFKVRDLTNRIDRLTRLITPVRPTAASQSARIASLIQQRAEFLAEEVKSPGVQPITLRNGFAPLPDWTLIVPDPAARVVGPVRLPDGRQAWHVAADRSVSVTWGLAVQLPRGLYEFKARVKTRAVVAGRGAGSGASISARAANFLRSKTVTGTHDWQEISCRLAVYQNNSPVQLRLEVQNAQGEVWFDRDSVTLQSVEPSR